MLPPAIDPLHHQPPLPLPEGFARAAILDALTGIAIDGGGAGELESYAREDCDRFLHTLALLPPGPARVLEVGSNPYFLTTLMRTFRPDIDLTLTNYFGGATGMRRQRVRIASLRGGEPEEFDLDYLNVDIETQALPFDDGRFDVVLYCEVIEHMTHDPLRSLLTLKRVLRPGGALILTTPNVARLENVARLVAGANLYDPYSGYGPHGRHNREYTRHELHHLLRYCGFREEVFFTADVHPNRAGDYLDPAQLEPLVAARAADLGQYLFTRCINDGPAPDAKPGWLYRSYPAEMIDAGEQL